MTKKQIITKYCIEYLDEIGQREYFRQSDFETFYKTVKNSFLNPWKVGTSAADYILQRNNTTIHNNIKPL